MYDNLRKCEVGGKRGYFHCWEQKSEIIEPSPMIGGHGGGCIAYVLAIIELEDGTITTALPYHVRFINDGDLNDDIMITKALSEPHGSE